MKKTLLLITMALFMMNCKKAEEQVTEAEIEVTYAGFGAKITPENTISQAEMTEKIPEYERRRYPSYQIQIKYN